MIKKQNTGKQQEQVVEVLRRQIDELESDLSHQFKIEKEMAEVEHYLRERVKELKCLYGVAELTSGRNDSVDRILQGVADLLPVSWQYPEITCARILLDGKEYISPNFKPTKWRQAADMMLTDNETIGIVEVYYLQEMPVIDEGPFLKEERLLIDAVADHLIRSYERIKLECYLKERVKELTCLYSISRLIEFHGNETDKILMGVVDVIPGAWQYPDITCARIILDSEEYTSTNFNVSQWKQVSDIQAGNQKIGSIEVYYLEDRPLMGEGPFLKEERLLLNAISERIGRVIERIRAEYQLEVERTSLKNKNIALREIMERVEEEKRDIGDRIHANVDKIVMPILHALAGELPNVQLGYIKLIETNLKEITSPFTAKISNQFSSLSPVETQISNWIKNGFTSKEIAKLRGISVVTVHRHRENIRKKMGIKNKNVNLMTYLNCFIKE